MLLSLCVLLVAGPSQVGEVALDRYRPSPSADALLDVPQGTVGAHMDMDAGLVLDYSANPLVVVDADGRRGALVGHRLALHALASISIFDWLRLGVDLPLLLTQSSDDEAIGIPALASGAAGGPGFGDLRIASRVRIFRAAEREVDVALGLDLTLPTATPRRYLGDRFFTLTPEVFFSRAFVRPRLTLGGSLGYRARPSVRVGDADLGPEIVFGAGARWEVGLFSEELGLPVRPPVALAASLTGAAAPEAPAELKLGLIFYLPLDLQLDASWGVGLGRGAGAPDVRFILGLRYTAREWDTDGDGVIDAEDECPGAVEDRDRYQDWDGCPDPDNDNDGVLDEYDDCPFVSGDEQGGCPKQ